ncbi:MAG: hypothetical protein WBG76_05250 [Ornithinimicrobium sp.]
MPDAPNTTPDEAAFRDLAQASRRLWRTIEFEHTNRERGTVRAWIRRPFDLRVEAADGTITVEDSRPRTPRAMLWAVFDSADKRMPVRYAEAPELEGPASEAESASDAPSAHVEARERREVEMLEDPIYENYRWAAMLRPDELAVGGRRGGV